MDKLIAGSPRNLRMMAESQSLRAGSMKITKIDAYAVSIPFRPVDECGISPFISSQATTTGANKTLIRVVCDGGAAGWSEIPTKLPSALMLSLIETELAGRVIGLSALQPQEIFDRTRFSIGRDRIETSLFAAGLEAACWDAVGHALNAPVHELLGEQFRTSIPACYYMGILSNAEASSLALWGIENGYRATKLKIGLDLKADEARIRACKEAAGKDLEIRVDANQSMSRDEASSFLARIDSLGLQYIEQPLPIGAYEDYRALRRQFSTPIAVNEDCFLPNGLSRAIHAEAIDAAVVDLDSSGISGLIELAEIADQAGIPLAHHCTFDLGIKTAAVLQTTCTRPVFSYAMDTVYPFLLDDILEQPLCIQDGNFVVPDGSGWGIEVSMDKVEEYRVG